MQATLKTQFDAQFHGADIEVFKSVIQLAIERLRSSPVRPLSGTPLQSQAGLKGKDLIDAKNMITRLANELGMDEPELEPSERRKKDDAALHALLFSVLAPAIIKAQFRTPPRHIFGLDPGTPT